MANLVLMMVATSVGFSDVFLLNLFATKVTLHLLKFSDLAYDARWYKYPPKLRNPVRFMIQNAQRPKLYTGFGVINCNLNAFARVTMIRSFISNNQKKFLKKSYFSFPFFLFIRRAAHEHGIFVLFDAQKCLVNATNLKDSKCKLNKKKICAKFTFWHLFTRNWREKKIINGMELNAGKKTGEGKNTLSLEHISPNFSFQSANSGFERLK